MVIPGAMQREIDLADILTMPPEIQVEIAVSEMGC
jgi:hypothetical protein